jgi:hypothetical protein
MKASCVVLTYKRHHNLAKIVDQLLQTPRIAEVIIWNNDATNTDKLTTWLLKQHRSDPIHLVSDSEKRNLYTMGRFNAAKRAACGVVCTQDDDVLVTPDKWERLFEEFENHGRERLVCYLDEGHLRWGRTKYKHRYQHGAATRTAYETLLGWGSVFQRDWAFDLMAEYFSLCPFDDLSVRKADRIFTVMLDQEHVQLKDRIEHLEGATGAEALYRQQDHWQMNQDAIKRALYVLSTRP